MLRVLCKLWDGCYLVDNRKFMSLIHSVPVICVISISKKMAGVDTDKARI